MPVAKGMTDQDNDEDFPTMKNATGSFNTSDSDYFTPKGENDKDRKGRLLCRSRTSCSEELIKA